MDAGSTSNTKLSKVMFSLTGLQSTYSIAKANGKVLVKLEVNDEGADPTVSTVRSFSTAGSPLDAFTEASIAGTYALVSGKSTSLFVISGPAGKETATFLKAKGVIKTRADVNASQAKPVWKGPLRWESARGGKFWVSKSDTDPKSLATITFKSTRGSISASIELPDETGNASTRVSGMQRLK
jgi:hypothetical protein